MPLDGNYDESDDSQSLASFSLFLLLSGWYTLCHGICVCNASFWMIAFLFLFFSFFSLGYEIIRTHCCSVHFVWFYTGSSLIFIVFLFSMQLLVFCSYCGFTFAKELQLMMC